jgi:hypothetical protein
MRERVTCVILGSACFFDKDLENYACVSLSHSHVHAQHFEKMQADVAQQFEKVQADVYKHKEEDPGMVKIIVGDDLRFPEQPVAVVCELEPICPDDELEPIRPYHRSPYHSPVDQHLRFDELPRLMSSRDELTRPDPHIAVRDELEPSHPYHSQTRMLLSETSWSTATFNDPPVAYHLHFKDEVRASSCLRDCIQCHGLV